MFILLAVQGLHHRLLQQQSDYHCHTCPCLPSTENTDFSKGNNSLAFGHVAAQTCRNTQFHAFRYSRFLYLLEAKIQAIFSALPCEAPPYAAPGHNVRKRNSVQKNCFFGYTTLEAVTEHTLSSSLKAIALTSTLPPMVLPNKRNTSQLSGCCPFETTVRIHIF